MRIIVGFVVGAPLVIVVSVSLAALLLSGELNPQVSYDQYRSIVALATLFCALGGAGIGLFICWPEIQYMRKNP